MVLHFHKNNIPTKINTSCNTKNNLNFDPKNTKAAPVTPAEVKTFLKFQDMGTYGIKKEKKFFLSSMISNLFQKVLKFCKFKYLQIK